METTQELATFQRVLFIEKETMSIPPLPSYMALDDLFDCCRIDDPYPLSGNFD